jgi:ribosome-binding protein aMBF1 (putative translation factor)
MSAGCSNSTSRTPAKCMRDFHVCAHCHKLGHSVTTCRSTPSSLQADQNSQERPFSGVSEVDDTPLQPQPTIFAES